MFCLNLLTIAQSIRIVQHLYEIVNHEIGAEYDKRMTEPMSRLTDTGRMHICVGDKSTRVLNEPSSDVEVLQNITHQSSGIPS
jgi:hypothetical protein